MSIEPAQLLTTVISVFAAAAGGGGIFFAIAKRYVLETFEAVDCVKSDLSEMKTDVAVIKTKMETVERIRDRVDSHTVKIATIEARNAANGACLDH